MSTVGAIIAKLRKEKEVGQKELAVLLNMSVATISNYEKGVHSPDLSTICKLADYFQVTTDYLLGRTSYRCAPEILDDYLISDFTINNIVNTLLSLSPEARSAVIHYANYMKDMQDIPDIQSK
ncbi:MAG: helix-turn-helix transcriptional regulator [Lachnospiraceae bacterium]|nr:helix-turn-helix transcriptional regulator [Lachnospiraceae bacterium]